MHQQPLAHHEVAALVEAVHEFRRGTSAWKHATTQLLRQVEPEILKVCNYKRKHAHDAFDCAQEALLGFYLKVQEQGAKILHPVAFAKGIAAKKCADAFRTDTRERAVPQGSPSDDFFPAGPAPLDFAY